MPGSQQVSWRLAFLRGLATNLLAAAGADRLGGTLGLAETIKLSRLAGTIAFIFVFVPSLIAAFQALNIEAISRPATEMLQSSWRRCRTSSRPR